MTPRIRAVLLSSALAVAGCAAGSAYSQAGPEAVPPSPPPDAVPPPPGAGASLPAGQWVYTQQYGWIWAPYQDGYAYLPPDGTGEPLEYVFYPAYGWTWVAAPWMWGTGVRPYFGRPGPARFAWYQHGWYRSPSRWHYRPGPERADAPRGVRPGPRRSARAAPVAPRGREERGGNQRGGRERGEREGREGGRER